MSEEHILSISTDGSSSVREQVVGDLSSQNSTKSKVINTWLKSGDSNVEHEIRRPFWITMINNLKESSLSNMNVLDFGCSRGGFLDTLYSLKPFALGMGVDISHDAIERARGVSRNYPVEFFLGDGSEVARGSINIAFSYEVIWLLRDLEQHAQYIDKVLAPGGVYYAATGCHTQHPRWEEWVKIISNDSNLPPSNHSPEDFVKAFKSAGFAVSARQLCHQDFVPVMVYPEYFPTVMDTIRFYSQETIVFRFEKVSHI